MGRARQASPGIWQKPQLSALPIRNLLENKLICEAVNERVAGGFHRLRYAITTAGLAALEQESSK